MFGPSGVFFGSLTTPPAPAAKVDSADNGVSLKGTTVVLGQDSGDPLNPAALLNNREIPMRNRNIAFVIGTFPAYDGIVATDGYKWDMFNDGALDDTFLHFFDGNINFRHRMGSNNMIMDPDDGNTFGYDYTLKRWNSLGGPFVALSGLGGGVVKTNPASALYTCDGTETVILMAPTVVQNISMNPALFLNRFLMIRNYSVTGFTNGVLTLTSGLLYGITNGTPVVNIALTEGTSRYLLYCDGVDVWIISGS